MLIPSFKSNDNVYASSLSRRVNANSQLQQLISEGYVKLIKKGEC